MHLGLICRPTLDGFGANIGHCLLKMGHQVTYLGSAYAEHGGRVVRRVAELAVDAVPELQLRHHRRLARTAWEHGCDAVLTTQASLLPEAVVALRRNGIPTALWFPDCVANLGRHRAFAAPYRALFFKDPLLVQRLRDTIGLPVEYLPQACNRSWHRPVAEPGTERVIVLVGNTYLSRALLVRRLSEAGVPLAIYGAAVPKSVRNIVPAGLHMGRAVFREEKSRVFRSAAGVLNNLHPAEMQGVNLRMFEGAGAGGAVLCERRPGLSELFGEGTEMLAFTTAEELIGHARNLLADPDLTRNIGDAATRRAHAEHTYEHRLPTILARLA